VTRTGRRTVTKIRCLGMSSVYYICSDGTESGRKKDFESLIRLIGDGYVGFSENFEDKIALFKPFISRDDSYGRSNCIGKYQVYINK